MKSSIFSSLREKYSKIIYKTYKINYEEDIIRIEYVFEIPEFRIFNHYISVPKQALSNDSINQNMLYSIVFRLGIVELINYYKCVCPKIIEIKAGFINEYEKNWFKKLYYNGLGEFFYVNGIEITQDELFKFVVTGQDININNVEYHGIGNLIPIGGGKDSCVTLELMKNYDNKCFVINHKQVDIDCIGDHNSCFVKRIIDKKLLELNDGEYLSGHTPYSAMIAFLSYLVAYLDNRKYIVLSNEGSANEATIIGTNINHQYSKTYEFEKDFCDYVSNIFKIDIKYFSLLRPLKEIQIAYLFTKYPKYHKIFRSCNIGSKKEPWLWCNNCPKCLFIFIILRAFMTKENVVDIFGENLLDRKDLERDFLELIGTKDTKPFECVGTIEEVKCAMNRIINDDNSYLSKLYQNMYYEPINIDLSKIYYENNVIDEYLEIVNEAIKDAKF